MFHQPVRVVQQMVDRREFAEWRAYYNQYPWGDDWEQTAQLISWLAATVGQKVNPDELIPRVRRCKEKMTPAQVQEVFKGIFSSGNSRQRSS